MLISSECRDCPSDWVLIVACLGIIKVAESHSGDNIEEWELCRKPRNLWLILSCFALCFHKCEVVFKRVFLFLVVFVHIFLRRVPRLPCRRCWHIVTSQQPLSFSRSRTKENFKMSFVVRCSQQPAPPNTQQSVAFYGSIERTNEHERAAKAEAKIVKT